MKTVISSKIKVTDYPHELYAWAIRNLRLRNPEYDRKLRMGYWLGNTHEFINLYELHGHTLVLPYGVKDRIWEYIIDGEIVEDFAHNERVDFGADNIKLRDYQEQAIESIIKSHKTCGIIQAPAGSGKTILALKLAKRLGLKTLWITHTVDLQQQAKYSALQMMEEFPLTGMIGQGYVYIGTGITFASVQMLNRLDLQELAYEWDVIIVDECHRVGKSAQNVTMYEKVLNNLKARYRFGLSATVHRADGLIEATKALLGNVIYEVPEEAVADRIMKVSVSALQTDTPSSDEFLNTDGTTNYAALISYLANDWDRNVMLSQLIEREMKDHYVLVLSDRLSQLDTLQDMLPQECRDQSVKVDGKLLAKKARQTRAENIDLVRKGEKRVLFATYALAKEGLDIPRLDRLIMATPHSDYSVIVQALGRIARTFEGKSEPIAYDFVDCIPTCIQSFKKRTTVYRKQGVTFI